jgi:hypothetical protein
MASQRWLSTVTASFLYETPSFARFLACRPHLPRQLRRHCCAAHTGAQFRPGSVVGRPWAVASSSASFLVLLVAKSVPARNSGPDEAPKGGAGRQICAETRCAPRLMLSRPFIQHAVRRTPASTSELNRRCKAAARGLPCRCGLPDMSVRVSCSPTATAADAKKRVCDHGEVDQYIAADVAHRGGAARWVRGSTA